jgi:hypothetical protein
MMQRSDINVNTLLEENTVKRLFDLVLETAKEMPELQGKLPRDFSFVFDFETVLKRKELPKENPSLEEKVKAEVSAAKLTEANQFTKALHDRTCDLITNLVCACIENSDTPIPTDCKLLLVPCFNPYHWTASTVGLSLTDKEAIVGLARDNAELYNEKKIALINAGYTPEEVKRIVQNDIKNAVKKKYQLKENPANILRLFTSPDIRFYDSRDPNTPFANLYYDSARLQLEREFDLQNIPCSHQQGETCGDHSVFNAFFNGLLNQPAFINQDGSVTSRDLRAISQQLHALAVKESELHMQIALNEVDDQAPQEIKDKSQVEKKRLEDEIEKIKKSIQAVKPDLEKLLRRMYQYNVSLGLDLPNINSLDAKVEAEEKQDNRDRVNIVELPANKIQEIDNVLGALNDSNEETIREVLTVLLKEMMLEPTQEALLYDLGSLYEHFKLDKQVSGVSSVVDALMTTQMDKIAANASQEIIKNRLSEFHGPLDIIKKQVTDSTKQIILLQRLADSIVEWNTKGIITLSKENIREVLGNDYSAEQKEAVVNAAQALFNLMGVATSEIKHENVYVQEKIASFFVKEVEQLLHIEIAASRTLSHIQAILAELDILSSQPNLEVTLERLASLLDDVIHDSNNKKEEIGTALGIELNEESNPRVIASLLIDKNMESIVREECKEILENTCFLMEQHIDIIKKQVTNPVIQQKILEKITEHLNILNENKESDLSEEEIVTLLGNPKLSEENERAVINAAKELMALATDAVFASNQKNDYLNAMKAPIILRELQLFLDKKTASKPMGYNRLFSIFINWLKKPAIAQADKQPEEKARTSPKE